MYWGLDAAVNSDKKAFRTGVYLVRQSGHVVNLIIHFTPSSCAPAVRCWRFLFFFLGVDKHAFCWSAKKNRKGEKEKKGCSSILLCPRSANLRRAPPPVSSSLSLWMSYKNVLGYSPSLFLTRPLNGIPKGETTKEWRAVQARRVPFERLARHIISINRTIVAVFLQLFVSDRINDSFVGLTQIQWRLSKLSAMCWRWNLFDDRRDIANKALAHNQLLKTRRATPKKLIVPQQQRKPVLLLVLHVTHKSRLSQLIIKKSIQPMTPILMQLLEI